MGWEKTDFLLNKRLNQHGLGGMVKAGLLCHRAEELLPDTFRAISVKGGTMHLVAKREDQMKIKMKEGWLLKEINSFAKEKKLTPVNRIRLTFESTSPIL